ncbi:Hsp20/alpha crystallin family protein [bacterium]|nr:Hsp20/alpha crystallin family protein [bacterium]
MLLTLSSPSYFSGDRKECRSANQRDRGSIPIEWKEYRDRIIVRAELPGIPRDSVELSYRDRCLVVKVSGTVPTENDGQPERSYSEFTFGNRSRMVAIPDEVEVSGIEAGFVDGVLTIRLPKRKGSTDGYIPIKQGHLNNGAALSESIEAS